MKYTITVTSDQLKVLETATAVLARLGFGQLTSVLEHLPLNAKRLDSWNQDVGLIQRLVSQHIIDNTGGGNDSTRIAWDIHQVIRHRLAWDYALEKGYIQSLDSPRQWPEMMQVHYDEPLKSSNHSLIDIKHEVFLADD